MSKTPTVSVVMITYNHEKFVEEAIHGVLIQNCDFNIELIIANDKSSDSTDKVITNYLSKVHIPDYLKIEYTNHLENKGMMSNFIWALQQAKGKYIAYCEGDDYWTDPLKLQKQVDFLGENEEYVLCFTNCKTIDESNKVKNPNFLATDKDKDYTINDLMFVAPTLTRVFRNQYLNVNYGKVIALDAIMLIEQVKLGKARYLNINTSNYRKHDKGIWSLKSNLEKKINYFDVRFYGFKNTNGNVKKSFLKQCLKAISKIRLLDKLKSEEKYNEFNDYYIKNKYSKSVKVIVYLFSLLNTNHLLSDKIIYKLQIRLIDKI